MAVNHFTQQLFPTRRLLATMVAVSFAGIMAAGAMALIAWIGLALLGFFSFRDKSRQKPF
jgi:hypothetical protein